MANTVAYKKFKKQVLINAQYECEICHISDGLTVHHMLKQSTFPQCKLDPVNGVCLCGVCHSRIERMWRNKENFYHLLKHRLDKAHDHFGVDWRDLGVSNADLLENS